MCQSWFTKGTELINIYINQDDLQDMVQIVQQQLPPNGKSKNLVVSCSVQETRCLSHLSLMLESQRSSRELLIFCLCQHPEEVASNTSEGMHQQQERGTFQQERKQTSKKQKLPSVFMWTTTRKMLCKLREGLPTSDGPVKKIPPRVLADYLCSHYIMSPLTWEGSEDSVSTHSPGLG